VGHWARPRTPTVAAFPPFAARVQRRQTGKDRNVIPLLILIVLILVLGVVGAIKLALWVFLIALVIAVIAGIAGRGLFARS
jgi:fatty acid desaturase